MAAHGSSSTSSRTSRTSSTSDPARQGPTSRLGSPSAATVLGVAHLVHPFPSILAALVTVAIAAVAGGERGVVVRLGLAMLAIQFAIGAINDVADADRDRAAKRAKPIPAGSVSPQGAAVLGIVLLVIGLVLAASAGPGTLGLAAFGAGAGILYDLRLKGTPVSWLGFTLGIPALPLFAWLGATDTIPGAILVAAAVAVPAGAGLAFANESPDLELDESAGVSSMSRRLGRHRAWAAGAALQAVVAVSATVGFVGLGGRSDLWPVFLGTLVVLGLGVGLGAGASVRRRQHGWEMQAVAIGLLAAVWLAAVPRQG
jgi:4-hydroxybenzoate polyprenyltransferase